MDYFTLAGVCKRTGAAEHELAVFGLKENTENALNASEVNFPSYELATKEGARMAIYWLR